MNENRFHGRKILICEDDVLQSRAYRKMLLKAGAEVEVSRTGEEAVSIAAKQRPDLLLMDINLPGIDGLEALRQLRRSHAATCIIMVTAYADETTIKRALIAGADGYLIKPVSVAEVADLWEERCRLNAGADGYQIKAVPVAEETDLWEERCLGPAEPEA